MLDATRHGEKVFVFSPKPFGDLHNYLKQRRKLKEGVAARLFQQIVLLVRDAHRKNVVLRDLKLKKFVFEDQENNHCDVWGRKSTGQFRTHSKLPASPCSKVVRGRSVWSNHPELTRNCPALQQTGWRRFGVVRLMYARRSTPLCTGAYGGRWASDGVRATRQTLYTTYTPTSLAWEGSAWCTYIMHSAIGWGQRPRREPA